VKIGLTSAVFNKQRGISRYVVELAERFVKDNEIHLLTSKYEHKIDGLNVVEDPIIWRPISAQVASNAILNMRRIKELKKSVDVVNSQGAEALNPDVVTMQSVQKAAVRQFIKDRGWGYGILKGFEPRNNVVLAIEKRALKNSKKVIAISNTVKKEVIVNYGLPDEKIAVIHSGVNLDEFNPKNKAIHAGGVRARHGLSVEDTVLMFSGWEFKRKGLQYIIESLPKIGDNAKVLVVGGASQKPYVDLARKFGVSDRVIFAGHRKNISEYYAASDMFVFPTSYEPFGLVITEAMATGIPVVTTKCAGAAELITDGVDGMLLKSPYDSGELAEKINHILDNNLADVMGKRARATAEKYSWESVAEKTLDVYRKTIQ